MFKTWYYSFKEFKTEIRDAFAEVDTFNKIIYNLFGNAIKYAESKVDVTLLTYHEDDASFTIRVKNDGYLISEEMKQKIFESFFRIPETKLQTGTSIGLALSLSFMKLHSGKLILEPAKII